MVVRPRDRALEAYRQAHYALEMGASPHQWQKGDILLEQCGPPKLKHGGDRRSAVFDGNLKTFINDTNTGESYETANTYRYVAWAFSTSARTLKVPWSCYRIVAWRDDRLELVQQFIADCERADANRENGVRYSSRRMEKLVGWKGTPLISREDRVAEVERGLRDMQPEERVSVVQSVVAEDLEVQRGAVEVIAQNTPVAAEAVKEIAKGNPKAVRQAIDDEETRNSFRNAESEYLRDKYGPLRVEEDPRVQPFNAAAALSDLQEAADLFASRVEQLIPHLADLPPVRRDPLGQKQLLSDAYDRAQQAINRVRAYIETGRTDLDEFIGSVLGGSRG